MKFFYCLMFLSLYVGLAESKSKEEKLWEAVRELDLPGVEKSLKAGADVNKKSASGFTALMIALNTGNLAMIELVLKSNPNVNLGDASGRTPLMIAAEKGLKEAVRWLLERGANPDAQDRDLRTPMMYAARNNMTEIIKILLKHHANSNLANAQGETVLMLDAKKGGGAMKALLAAGADVNAKSKIGTPLTYAVSSAVGDQQKMVNMLLSKNANPHEPDKDGQTPLIIAAQRGLDSVVALLLKAKAAVNEELSDRSTALTKALALPHETDIEKRQRRNIVRSLLRAGAVVPPQAFTPDKQEYTWLRSIINNLEKPEERPLENVMR